LLNKQAYMKRISQWMRTNSVYIAIISVLPLPFLFSDTVVLNYMDMYDYLEVVKEFQNGHWSLFFTKTRTNLFPLILFLNFKIFGANLLAIKYLYVFVMVILLLECWILGKLLFKNNSGIIAAILACTSYTYVHFLYFPHIDLLLLAMLILCLIVMFVAVELKSDSKAWLLLSGLLLGLTILLKESALWLLFIVPIYSLLTRLKLKRALKIWCIQLVPLILLAGPFILSHHNAFYRRYINKLFFWISVICSGDTSRIHNLAGGVFQPEASLFNIFTFPFAPILWQWEPIFPTPNNLILFEQLTILLIGVLFFVSKSTVSQSKMFLVAILIVFMPRYIVFSVSGYKLRQVLITFFIFYPILGNWIYRFIIKLKIAMKSYTDIRRIRMGMVLFVFTFYILRMTFCIDGIAYTLNSAEFNYQRRQILPLQSEVK